MSSHTKLIDIRRILNLPSFYLAYRNMVGGNRASSIYVKEYIRPNSRDKILDIGCGPGDIVEHFPDVDYTGFDNNSDYINSATRKYGDRGVFFCGLVDEVTIKEAGTYDLVLATGILHHLDDCESIALFELAKTALKKGGRLITFDGCFVEGQSKIARYIISRDRGQFVRTSEEYFNLAAKVFPDTEAGIRHDLLRIPYTHIILECRK
ncbi:MAG: class I SAM-dependent methyltransferase [Gallionella sp.]|nr:class I SAM-dependent methyltransferase [Gallionella sp.]